MKHGIYNLLIAIIAVSVIQAGAQGHYQSSKQAIKAKSSLFSSLPTQLKTFGSSLRVANLEEDGRVQRKFYFPAVHPMIQLSFAVSTDYFTESFEVDYNFNQTRQLKVKLPDMFQSQGMMVPLSIRSKRGKARH